MHTQRRNHLRTWARLVPLACLSCLMLTSLAAIDLLRAPHADAAGADPVIHWDGSMIYSGQNNGFPWGPVGEHALVHGEKFTDPTVIGQQISLSLVKGDVLSPPGGGSAYEFCKLAGPKVALGKVMVDGSGTFDYSFTWPAAAGSGSWSICAYNTLDGLPAGNIDDGPFAVLSGSKPSVAVSRTSVPAGEQITVTGAHWTPPQDVSVYIGACADCDGPIVTSGTAHSSGLHTGTFSITFTIPASATPGDYVVGATAHGGILDVGPSGAKKLAITVAPTPTVAPTTVPATAGTGSGGNTDTSSGSLGGVSPLVLALVGVGMLFLLLLVILIVVLSRRGARPTTPGATSGPPPGWGGSGSSGAANDYQAFGAGSVQQNWGTLAPGWGEQTPPTVTTGSPSPEGGSTQANVSYAPDRAIYPLAPPPASPASPASPPVSGETPTQPGNYGNTPPDPYNP
jgi:hypothetical protein